MSAIDREHLLLHRNESGVLLRPIVLQKDLLRMPARRRLLCAVSGSDTIFNVARDRSHRQHRDQSRGYIENGEQEGGCNKSQCDRHHERQRYLVHTLSPHVQQTPVVGSAILPPATSA